MNNLLKLNGKRVKFGNDIKICLGTKDTMDIVVNVKKGSEFIVGFDGNINFSDPDGWIKFSYDNQWITLDENDLDGEYWEEGLSLLLIEA